MKRFSLILLLPSLILSLTAAGFSQGVLTGVITDSLTGEALIAAEVYFPGTAVGAATDLNGKYRIDAAPTGTQLLKISYVGYTTKEVSVTIKEEGVTVFNTSLIPGIIEGEVIQVTAQALGQAAAMNQQIKSKNIINVVSEEKIQELPDVNAAESVGRLPGVSIRRSGGEAQKIVMRGLSDKYSTITIDGARISPTDADARGVDLSAISQGSLAGIELSKALTSDMDADAIAGSVNFVTKKAPEERLVRFETRGAYNKLNNTYAQYDLKARYGERFFDNKLGVQVSGNIEQRDRSSDYLELDYNQNLSNGTQYRISDFFVRFTEEERERYGASAIFDFNTPDGGSIRFNNTFNKTKRSSVEHQRNYPNTLDGNIVYYDYRDLEQNTVLFNSSLGGENYLFGLTSDWLISYSDSRSEDPFDYEMNFREPQDNFNLPYSGMDDIPERIWTGPADIYPYFAYNNFNRAYLYTAFYRGEENNDSELSFALNVSKSYTLGNLFSGELKFGGKYRTRSRDRAMTEQYAPYYNSWFGPYYFTGSTILRKNYSGSRFDNLALSSGGGILFSNFLDANPKDRNVIGEFRLYPLVSQDAMREWWDLNQYGLVDSSFNRPEYLDNPESEALYYDITERIAAGYLMHTFNYTDMVTFICGIRLEMEDNDYDTRYSPSASGGFPTPTLDIHDTTAVHKEENWLPNFHLIVKPVEFFKLRLAAYKALARPDFNHRLPNYVIKPASTFFPGNNFYLGNTDLKTIQAWNYEINSTFFSRMIGLFSVSLFYKDIKGMINYMDGLPVTRMSDLERLGLYLTNPFPGNPPIVFYYPYNTQKPTWVKGIEIEHQANLTFLPGLWKNLVLNYNMSFVESQTYVPFDDFYTVPSPIPGFPPTVYHRPGETKAKLEGQPEFFGNFAMGYDIGGFSVRLSVFHQGEYYSSFSTDQRSDVIIDDFTRLDLAVKQEITKNFALLLNISNITNVEEKTKNHNKVEDWKLLNTAENYGTVAEIGLRFIL
jgi:TonB-dependent receptor